MQEEEIVGESVTSSLSNQRAGGHPTPLMTSVNRTSDERVPTQERVGEAVLVGLLPHGRFKGVDDSSRE